MAENNRFEKTIAISKEIAAWLNKKLTTEPSSESDCFGEDEKYSVTAIFDNDYEMDIEMCGVRYNEGESNTPWTQAILFNDQDSECTFTEPCDTFIGEWQLDYDDMTFIVNGIIEN